MPLIETLSIARWDGPVEATLRLEALAALEAGRVLCLPRLGFGLDAAEQRLLGAASGNRRSKNVSFDPATGKCRGTVLTGEELERLAAIMRRFAGQANSLVRQLAPAYAPGLKQGRTSFRPAEIAGREMSWRKNDRRLHVDAFPSSPTRGWRILRVFCNADPSGNPRRWRLGEPFEDHARRFLGSLRGPLPGAAAILQLTGLTKGRRTSYDHLMLRLHDAAKRDAGYQSSAPSEEVEFPAGSTWIVYTDQTPHAALAGRNAFEQTFYVDPAVMADPSRAPLRVLERMTGRVLA